MFGRLIRHGFSQAKEEFSKTYILRLKYKDDAYYITSPYHHQFKEKIRELQKSNNLYIFGGRSFPMTSTTLIFNCEDQKIPKNFAENNIFAQKNLIESYTIDEVNRISTNKLKTLTTFYQYK